MSYFSNSYYFDEAYYIRCKLAQLTYEGSLAPDGQAWAETSLREAFQNAGLTPQGHYETYGRSEGLNPSPYFNEPEYLSAKLAQLHSHDARDEKGDAYTLQSLVAAIEAIGLTPAEHYERYGAFETDAAGRFINPSNAFDANAYYAAKLLQCRESGAAVGGHRGSAITLDDILAAFIQADLSPISHYEIHGSLEARGLDAAFVQPVPLAQQVGDDPGRKVTGDATAATTFLLEQDFHDAAGGTGANTFIVHADTLSSSVMPGTPSCTDAGEEARAIYLGGGAKDRIILAEGGTGNSSLTFVSGTDGADILEVAGSEAHALYVAHIDLKDGNNICSIDANVTVTGLHTGTGDDIITIGADGCVQSLHAGGGDDVVTINSGGLLNFLYTSGGSLTLQNSANAELHSIWGSAGDDAITVNGGTVKLMVLGAGDDAVTLNQGASVSELYTKEGRLTLSGNGTVGNINTHGNSPHNDYTSGDDHIIINGVSVGTVYAGQGDDVITITNGSISSLWGGEGNDMLRIRGTLDDTDYGLALLDVETLDMESGAARNVTLGAVSNLERITGLDKGDSVTFAAPSVLSWYPSYGDMAASAADVTGLSQWHWDASAKILTLGGTAVTVSSITLDAVGTIGLNVVDGDLVLSISA